MANVEPVLDIRGVSKAFWKDRPLRDVLLHPLDRTQVQVLQEVSLTIHRGESVALVGPNGAGKTTLAKIASGTLIPDAGTSQLLGQNSHLAQARAHQSMALPEDSALHPRLTLDQALRSHLALFGMDLTTKDFMSFPEAQALRLDDLLHRRVATLSAGEKARASLAKALLTSPDLLILDELSRVLDPHMAQVVAHILEARQEQGLAILAITHDMNVAQKCDRVALITSGKIVQLGTWNQVSHLIQQAFEGVRNEPTKEQTA